MQSFTHFGLKEELNVSVTSWGELDKALASHLFLDKSLISLKMKAMLKP